MTFNKLDKIIFIIFGLFWGLFLKNLNTCICDKCCYISIWWILWTLIKVWKIRKGPTKLFSSQGICQSSQFGETGSHKIDFTSYSSHKDHPPTWELKGNSNLRNPNFHQKNTHLRIFWHAFQMLYPIFLATCSVRQHKLDNPSSHSFLVSWYITFANFWSEHSFQQISL